ncbi:MAG: hypothetical protein IKJ52_08610 [Muribaculaceae bacterium]|nr:hypothetical protein [Muribaculaceae bacterium]
MDKKKGKILLLLKKLTAGKSAKVSCPFCKNEESRCFDEKGRYEVKCEFCGNSFFIDVIPVTEDVKRGLPYKGKIRLLRRLWFSKDFPLHSGANIIGRYEPQETINPHIAIENDDSISRRAITIIVTKDEQLGGFFFKLKVHKNVNVVLHNNVKLKEGDEANLNYGDTIVLGRTKLRFEK